MTTQNDSAFEGWLARRKVEAMVYGTKGDFVRDWNFTHYLSQGIISKESSRMPGWEKVPAKYIDVPRIPHRTLALPLVSLEYHSKTITIDLEAATPLDTKAEETAPLDTKTETEQSRLLCELQTRPKFWDFDVVQVELPEGWSFERGCECGASLNPSSFMVKQGDDIKGNFAYFPNETAFLRGIDELMIF